eukprot:TRINITY_DN9512_c1_g2_i1.p1 TRINITY_DN9512_c1_g2~~TRINITY_DN9512_c1_g2_i1.p1  ORF type:complete len:740 (-),score=148.47 TRINITY_DN9512_c1_g2_i1:152-2107(-)
MAPNGCVKVCGEDPFRGSSGKKTALVVGGWRGGIGEDRADAMKVFELLGLEEGQQPSEERTQKLWGVLGLNRLLKRFYGTLSDGERRRVDLGRKLREPRQLLLLDEATSDLDLLTRNSLLDFLSQEAKDSNCTVLNVTHVFDGLDPWTTHVMHVHDGSVLRCDNFSALSVGQEGGFFAAVSKWLLEAQGSAAAFESPFSAPAATRQKEEGQAIEVKGLEYGYGPDSPVVVRLDSLELPRGCRCLLVGLNGSGKSSLLSLLAGRRLISTGDVRILNHRAFHDYKQLDSQVSILSTEWKRQVSDLSSGRSLAFKDLAQSMMTNPDPAVAARMVRLIQMLGIDPTKAIGLMSDGMVRRVQIALKLIRPAEVLLVDEVTADLDVQARQALLKFLREEAEAGSTVIYCTHIMDGLGGWASHLLRLRPAGCPSELLTADKVPGTTDADLFSFVRARMQDDVKSLEELRRASRASEGVGRSDGGEDLPLGWQDRQRPGAYGKYAWTAENGSEDTWNFASVAPEPSNNLPTMTPAAASFAVAAAGGPCAATGMPGMPGMPGMGVGGMGMGGMGMGGMGMGGMGMAGGFAGGGMPGAGGYGASGGVSAPIPSTPQAAMPVSQSASLANDPSPFGPGPRSNQISEAQLLSDGRIMPDRSAQ